MSRPLPFLLLASLTMMFMSQPLCASDKAGQSAVNLVQFSRQQASRSVDYVALSAEEPKFSRIDIVGGEQINTIAGLVVKEWCYMVEVIASDPGLYWVLDGEHVISRPLPKPESGQKRQPIYKSNLQCQDDSDPKLDWEREVFCTLADDSIFRLEFSAHPETVEYQVNLELLDICFRGSSCE